MKLTSLFTGFMFFICTFVGAQTLKNGYKCPGKGLKQHDFLYVGEWDMRNPQGQKMFVVRDGKVVWQYSIPLRTATG